MDEAVNLEEVLSIEELQEAWPVMDVEERNEAFRLLPREEGEDYFLSLHARDQVDLLEAMRPAERRSWMRLLAPDDAVDVVQEAPPKEREGLLAHLDDQTRREVGALLAYAEDSAGGLMSPRYARLRPEMGVDEAISYLRRQTRDNIETISYVFVLDPHQKLLGTVRLIDLFQAPAEKKISDIMWTDVVAIPENLDQEKVSQLFAQTDLTVMPVVDADGHMKGIVTVDDIVDVVQEEATEDIHKYGAVAALDAPYLEIGLAGMVRKRAGWLSILCVTQMLTATVLARYEAELSQAVILAIFIPFIISSGGNSGSQASTLVVRAIALGELRLRDWWRVIRRELYAGLSLGAILGVIGFARIALLPGDSELYRGHIHAVALTVAAALVGVVTFGTLVGSMLPFMLRRVGLDPASASAPFVATLVDVTGLIIYFSLASVILKGLLL